MGLGFPFHYLGYLFPQLLQSRKVSLMHDDGVEKLFLLRLEV
jgi:hypothetical protein